MTSAVWLSIFGLFEEVVAKTMVEEGKIRSLPIYQGMPNEFNDRGERAKMLVSVPPLFIGEFERRVEKLRPVSGQRHTRRMEGCAVMSDCSEPIVEQSAMAALADAISHWVEYQIESGNAVPDFFSDECDTSECLAEHLVQLGWHR